MRKSWATPPPSQPPMTKKTTRNRPAGAVGDDLGVRVAEIDVGLQALQRPALVAGGLQRERLVAGPELLRQPHADLRRGQPGAVSEFGMGAEAETTVAGVRYPQLTGTLGGHVKHSKGLFVFGTVFESTTWPDPRPQQQQVVNFTKYLDRTGKIS